MNICLLQLKKKKVGQNLFQNTDCLGTKPLKRKYQITLLSLPVQTRVANETGGNNYCNFVMKRSKYKTK